jgi:natural product precursor
MKKLAKLKLIQLSKAELEKRQMNTLFGGTNDDNSCNCNCKTTTTLSATRDANASYGYQYSYGGDGSYTGTVNCTCSSLTPMANIRGGLGL